MPLDISFQPIPVRIDGHDSEGRLILVDSQLAAVLVRPDGNAHDPAHKGLWHLEAGFGKCEARSAPLFRTPEEAGAWVGHILRVEEPEPPAPLPGKAAEFRRRAQECRTVARQISLTDARDQLLENATHLEVLAADEEHHEAKPKPLARE